MPVTEDTLTEVFKRIQELEAGKAQNRKDIELLEQKFLLEVRGIHDVLKSIAKGETYGCMKEEARITALEKEVIRIDGAVSSKTDHDDIATIADKTARDIVALALVTAKADQDKMVSALNLRVNALYGTVGLIAVALVMAFIKHLYG